MSQHNVVELVPVGNLFAWVEGTGTSQVLAEALAILRRCPAILAAIEADQDRHGCRGSVKTSQSGSVENQPL